jgi:RNA 3'-terminal phosphate cyclase
MRDVRALVSNLPLSIAERELSIVRKHLSWAGEVMNAHRVEATGPGNIVLIAADYAYVSEVATGFGRRGVPAEKVAKEAVECWQAYESTDAPVGEHLACRMPEKATSPAVEIKARNVSAVSDFLATLVGISGPILLGCQS